jgi:hypothetical protein
MDLTPALDGLTDRQRLYVEQRLSGKSVAAAAAIAGYASGAQVERNPDIQAALNSGRAISARAVGFTREEAHDMLMQAYRNAESASEQVMAVRELVKLHGIAEPIKHEHTHKHELRALSDDELLRLAGGRAVFQLPPALYPQENGQEEGHEVRPEADPRPGGEEAYAEGPAGDEVVAGAD